MSSSSCQRRCRTKAATLAAAICAGRCGRRVSADTLRSALISSRSPRRMPLGRAQRAASRASSCGFPTPRGSSAIRLRRFAPRQVTVTAASPCSNFSSLAIPRASASSEVRLLSRSEPFDSLRRLRAIVSIDQYRRASSTSLPAVLPWALSGGRDWGHEFVIDAGLVGRGLGASSGGVIGLMFELGPGETIDTLIDQRLARSELLPQVLVTSLADGTRLCALSFRRVDSRDRAPLPHDNISLAKTDLAASTAPVSRYAVADGGTLLEPGRIAEPTLEQLRRKLTTRIPRGVRAREPPQGAA